MEQFSLTSPEHLDGQRWFRQMADLIPDSIYVLDMENQTTVYRNQGINQILGLADEDVPADSCWGYFSERLHPEDQVMRAQTMQSLADAVDGTIQEVEQRMRHADGSWRWLKVRERVIERGTNGSLKLILGIASDITKEKEDQSNLRWNEEQYRNLYNASQRQAQEMTLLDQARVGFGDDLRMPTLLERIVESVSATFAYGMVSLYLAESNRLVLGYSIGLQQPQSEIPLRASLEGQAIRSRQPLLITADQQQPDFDPNRLGISAQLVVPVYDQDQLIAVLNIYTGPGDMLSQNDLRLMTVLRPHIVAVLGQARLYKNLRESEDRFRTLWAASQRQAQELRLLDQARSAVASILEPQLLIRTILEAIAETFGYTLVSLYLYNDTRDMMILQYQIGYDNVISQFRPDQGVSSRVLRSGQGILLEDVTTDPDFLGAIPGIVSEVCVPLFNGQDVVGILNVESTDDVRFTKDDLRVMTALSQHVSAALERAQLFNARVESEQRLSQITENSNQIFSIFDLKTQQLLYVSSAFERLTQQPASFLEGDVKQMVEIIHPDDRRQALAVYLLQKASAQFRILWPDGTLRWLEARVFPVYNSQGEIYRYVGVTDDITERKAIETAEHEQRLLAEAFRDIAQTLSRTLDLEEVLDQVIATISKVVPYDMVTMMLLENGRARFVRYAGIIEPAFRTMAEHESWRPDDLISLKAMVSTQQPFLIADTSTYPGWRALNNQDVEASCLAVPILLESEVVGFIHVLSATYNFFTESHAERLSVFAEQAAIAIQNARLYKQAQVLATMEERQRLARDLHDAVSQTLFSASVVAETMVRVYERQTPEDIKRNLTELQRLTRGALAEMRNLLAELRPNALLETDFKILLKHLTDATAGHTQIPVTLKVQMATVLPGDVQVVFYRVAQEALSNIIKHARAKNVSVHCSYQNGVANMHIVDDGRGFDMSKRMDGHYGLAIMQERAATIDAEVILKSAPAQGTQVYLHWEKA
jgi:two-component system nitrate/nitrite sensor histidine kinase NarX